MACGQIPEKTPAAISLSATTMCPPLMLGFEFNPRNWTRQWLAQQQNRTNPH